VQLNLTFVDLPDPLGGLLSESLAPSLWEQLDEPARRARDPGAADCPLD
jgi:hypothetical protein